MKVLTLVRVFGMACIGLLGTASLVGAQAINGLHSSTPGARANGMGGTFIAIADDATAAISNPAGLVNLTRPQVYAEINGAKTGFGDNGEIYNTSLSFASFSAPIKSSTTIGFTYNEFYNAADKFSGEEFQGTGRSFGVSLATAVTSTLKLGATVTADTLKFSDIINSSKSSDSNSGVGFVAGGLWQATDKVSVGVAGNRGSSDAGNANRIGGGVSVQATPALLASVDIARIGSDLDVVETHVGGEYAVRGQSGTLLLRAGAYTGSNDPDHEDRGGTFGVGYAAKQKFQIDLAYVTKHQRFIASAGVRF